MSRDRLDRSPRVRYRAVPVSPGWTHKDFDAEALVLLRKHLDKP
jgi:hypothetical protein